MKKIGITGSLSSGKTTASKILSKNRGPLFSADQVVSNLYKKDSFKKAISKEFDIKNLSLIKKILKKKILEDGKNFKKLEKIIHPLVRREMKNFERKNYKKKFLFFEIPLLIESNLMKKFDLIFFIKANKKVRLKRFKLKGGNSKFFQTIDKKQFNDNKKVKYCDHVIVNEKNIMILKKKLLDIFRIYE